MKSRLEEDLKLGDYEGLVLNRLMIDVFKPKLCHEKDVLVAAFPVRNRATAHHLSLYLSEGPFNFINSEAAASPDPDGNTNLLVELDRNRELYTTLDQILQYINQLAHTADWHFKTPDTPEYTAWTQENFNRLVPQNPEEFLARKSAAEKSESTDSAGEAAAPPQPRAAQPQTESSPAQASKINYRLMAKIIEKQITRSNLYFIKEFQKQFKKIVKDNRLILQQFKELKSDQHYLYKQLELHQKREKLGLLREQQDFKRIRDLQDRLSNFIIAQTENSGDAPDRIGPDAIGVEQLQDQRPLEPGGEFEEAPAEASTLNASTPMSLQYDPKRRDDDDAPVSAIDIEPLDGPQSADLSSVETSAPGPTQPDETSPGPEQRAEESISAEEHSGSGALPPKTTGGFSEVAADRNALVAAPVTPEEAEDKPTSAAPPSPPEPTAGEADPLSNYFSQGMQASERKDYHTAIEHFTKITEIAPEEPRGYYNLAILYYRLKDYDTAHEYAKRALDLGAQAARRILEKVETKQSDLESLAADTIEFVSDGVPYGGGVALPEIEAEPAAAPAEVAEVPAPAAREEPPAVAAEVTAESEPEASGDTGTLPEFPVLTGVGPDPAAADDGSAPERFDYMDTMTISEVDLSPVEPDEADWSAENVFELSEPVPETEPESWDAPVEESEASRSADWAALEAVMTAGEAGPEPVQPAATQTKAAAAVPSPGAFQPAADAAEAPAETATAATPASEPAAETPTASEPAVDAARATGETDAAATPHPAVADDDIEEFFTLGLAASAQKDYRQAVHHFQKFVEHAPDEPRGYYNLAILYYRLKDYDTAWEHAERALDLGAHAAQRILEKIEAKQSDLEGMATDTIEFATEGVPAAEGVPAGDGVAPPEVENEPAASQAHTVEPPAAAVREDVPPAAAEATAKSEPVAGTTSAPEFQAFTGIDPDPGPAEDGSEAEKIDYMDTMTVSDMDLSSVELGDGEVEDENVFELSEPVAAAAPTSRDTPGGKSDEAHSADWAALEEVMTAAEAVPESTQPAAAPAEAAATAAAAVAKGAAAARPAAVKGDETPARQMATADAAPTEPGAPEAPEPAAAGASAEDFFNLGMAASAQKDYRQAITYFQKFIEHAPDEPRGHYNLAILFYRLKKYETARHCADRALSLGAKAARRILEKIEKKTGVAAPPGPPGIESARPPASDQETPGASPSPMSPTGMAYGDEREEDTVIWDADELEEEVDTAEVDVDNLSTPYSLNDDVIFFGSSKVDADTRDRKPASADKADAASTPAGAAQPPASDQRRRKRVEAPSPKARTAEKGPADPEIERFFTLGIKAADQKEYLKAIQHFTKVTQLAIEDPRGYYNLAIVSYRLKFYETAREHAKRALELGAKAAQRIIDKIDAQQATV